MNVSLSRYIEKTLFPNSQPQQVLMYLVLWKTPSQISFRDPNVSEAKIKHIGEIYLFC